MTDNFEVFREFMQLPEKDGTDAYYVIELIRRGKDCPELPAANYHFKNYYIDTKAKYDSVQEEIRILCRTLHLRAYVSVCRKSFRRTTLGTIAEMSRRAALDDYSRPYAVFDSCSGKDAGKDDRFFIVDIDDNPEKTPVEKIWERGRVYDIINGCMPEGDKVALTLPTRSGIHFIARPFNVAQFQWMCTEDDSLTSVPDIKKNHLTLLYEDLQDI